jgi:hypothetical protein
MIKAVETGLRPVSTIRFAKISRRLSVLFSGLKCCLPLARTYSSCFYPLYFDRSIFANINIGTALYCQSYGALTQLLESWQPTTFEQPRSG